MIAASSAASPAPPVLTPLLCPVSAVLASLHIGALATTGAVSVIIAMTVHNLFMLLSATMVLVSKVEHVLLRRVGVLVFPESPVVGSVRVALGCWCVWGGGEKREDSKADAESGGGRQREGCVVVGGNGLMLLVVQGSWSWGNEEDISESQHGFIGF